MGAQGFHLCGTKKAPNGNVIRDPFQVCGLSCSRGMRCCAGLYGPLKKDIQIPPPEHPFLRTPTHPIPPSTPMTPPFRWGCEIRTKTPALSRSSNFVIWAVRRRGIHSQ